jgi:hypothetical protein
MTQSKKDDIMTVTMDDYVSGEDITINLKDTYGTTTTYWAGDSVTDVTYNNSYDGTFTITLDTIDLDSITINSTDWLYSDTKINPDEVERMCKEYPALEKVWRNFKSVYDMVKQDYEGKKKAGEIDDDIPF